jgi:hypothetical protein
VNVHKLYADSSNTNNKNLFAVRQRSRTNSKISDIVSFMERHEQRYFLELFVHAAERTVRFLTLFVRGAERTVKFLTLFVHAAKRTVRFLTLFVRGAERAANFSTLLVQRREFGGDF